MFLQEEKPLTNSGHKTKSNRKQQGQHTCGIAHKHCLVKRHINESETERGPERAR